jgi:tRNA pseudouridine32 synthase/23S rRNA pseudouridine746 synthase
VRLLHEDSRLLVVDKGAGDRVIPGREGAAGDSLRERLERERGERLWVVHRLDAGTSGTLVFARDEEAHRFLSRAFEGREVEKVYLALVEGNPAFGETAVDLPLHEARRGKMRPAAPGEAGAKPSRTELRVLERFPAVPKIETSGAMAPKGAGARRAPGPAAALVEARPHTGRHHQIRVHLKAIGHPLLVDPQYGRKEPLAVGGLRLARTPLHASRLELPHPAGGRLAIEAPLPPDLAGAIAALRASSGG